jgi:hypothetical protein
MKQQTAYRHQMEWILRLIHIVFSPCDWNTPWHHISDRSVCLEIRKQILNVSDINKSQISCSLTIWYEYTDVSGPMPECIKVDPASASNRSGGSWWWRHSRSMTFVTPPCLTIVGLSSGFSCNMFKMVLLLTFESSRVEIQDRIWFKLLW